MILRWSPSNAGVNLIGFARIVFETGFGITRTPLPGTRVIMIWLRPLYPKTLSNTTGKHPAFT